MSSSKLESDPIPRSQWVLAFAKVSRESFRHVVAETLRECCSVVGINLHVVRVPRDGYLGKRPGTPVSSRRSSVRRSCRIRSHSREREADSSGGNGVDGSRKLLALEESARLNGAHLSSSCGISRKPLLRGQQDA